MTRTVALGAVIGFALTVLGLVLLERSSTPSATTADAGAEAQLPVNPRFVNGFVRAQDRQAGKLMIVPNLVQGDGGSP
jgi:hypothetical protein